MGKVLITATGAVRRLSAWNALGRAANQTILIEDDGVSSQHAVVEWSDGGWSIRDRSTNNTWVDHKVIKEGVWVPLKQGARIGLARPDESLILIDDSPPSLFARRRDTLEELDADEEGVLRLPEGDVWWDDEQGWLCQDRNGTAPSTLEVGGWTIVPPRATLERTRVVGREFRKATAVFRQERADKVGLTLRWPDGYAVDFKPRVWFVPLMRIALRREAEDGWITTDDLVVEVMHNLAVVNTYLFNARSLIMAEPILGVEALYETDTGKRRFGLPATQIEFVKG
jgi:hypothetical protein